MLFIEAPRSIEEMRTVCSTFASRVPLMANMVEGGATPIRDVDVLAGVGYRLAIFPGALVRVLVWTLERFLTQLRDERTSAGWTGRMPDLAGLNAVLGAEDILAAGRRYDQGLPGAGIEPGQGDKERRVTQ
jgi:2-methylisocitrate lyase-like PEP mutase family enzyme